MCDKKNKKEMNLFNDRPWRLDKELYSSISAPEIVGYFSVDGEQNYLPDSSRMLYYNPPKSSEVYLDLNQGIESAVHPSIRKEGGRISHLLEWIELNKDKILSSDCDRWIKPKFACSCGALTSILCAPFNPIDRWIICAAKWRGTIYLCRFKTPEQLAPATNIQQKFGSWGFKFEQYMLSADPNKAPDTSQPVIELEEFRCVFQRRFVNHDVLITAEMDGVCSTTVLNDPLPVKKLKFIELKTKKLIEGERQARNFRKQLVKWWAQSFVVGTEKILCGFRDDNGIVKKLTTYSLEQIIDMSKDYWNPHGCIRYAKKFLDFISESVVNNCDETIYKFEKRPYADVVTTELPPTSDYAFIPSTFLAKTG